MIEDKFNIRNVIIRNIPKLIEVFVNFYGEENREKITEKFNKLIIAGYYTPDGLSNVLTDERKKIAEEAIKEVFIKETGIDDKKSIDKLFGYVSDFSYIPVVEMIKNNKSSDYFKKVFLDYINEYSGNNYSSLEDEGALKVIEELNNLLPSVMKTKEYFDNKYNELLKPYADYQDKIKQIDATLKDKYAHKYLEDIKDLLSDRDKKIIEGENFSDHKYELDCNSIYLGQGLNPFNTGLLEAFSKESEELVNDVNTTFTWKRQSVIDDRVSYFKKLGIDHGDNYEDYMNDPKCVALIPDEALINRIVETKEKYNNLYTKELLESLPHHKEVMDDINNADLLSNPDFARTVSNEITCISVNFTKENGNIVERPLLYYSGNVDEEMLDCRLIHELNHLYELHIQKIDGDKVTSICGWDIVEDPLDNNIEAEESLEYDENVKRNYEMFNEIINEFIAQDICKSMHEQSISVSGDVSKAGNTSRTSYEVLLGRFCKSFYEEFKEDIIESRKDGNINSLLKKIGKDNFEEYNNMLRDYADRFQGMKIYGLYRDLKEGKETEDTKYYYDCVDKTRTLLGKFRENKQEYLNNNRTI